MVRSPLDTRLARWALAVVIGIALVYIAARAGGAVAALLTVVALACAAALVLLREPGAADALTIDRVLDGIALLAPGALIVYLAFNSGGFFPDAPAVASIALIVVLVLRITLVAEPLAGSGWRLALAAGALALLAVWTLLSGTWSHSHGRALIAFDLVFLYLLVVVLVGSVVRTSSRLRWLAGALAVAALAVAIGALATRLLPDHFPVKLPVLSENNLAYPLTYSNALGIVCVLGGILSLYFAMSTRLPIVARALGAAAIPIFAVTVYLTLSRGPVLAAGIGVVAFLLLGRPRGFISGALAAGPASLIAVASAHGHSLLTSGDPTTAAAQSQGHHVALVLALCVLGAFAVRLLLAPLDARVARYSLPERRRRRVLIAAWSALALVVVVAVLAVNGPHWISHQYDLFVSSGEAGPQQTVEQGIFSRSNRGLVDNWSIAFKAFRDRPLDGQGAGAYEVYWLEHRPAKQNTYDVSNAHSLYLETLADLGIVGFVLLAVAIVAMLVALAPFGRGPNRPLYAALFATALAWAVHAGIDWDWQMPATTLFFFALGAAALANHESAVRRVELAQGRRVIFALLLLVGAIAPAILFTSQRQLNDARDALSAGNCNRAIDRAAASISTLSVRPEPYEILGICQGKRGRAGFSIAAMRKAVQKDPNNWRYHYDLGVALGGNGQIAYDALAAARRLNPTNAAVAALIKEAPPGTAVNWSVEFLPPVGATTGR
jgi:hypothetical protein